VYSLKINYSRIPFIWTLVIWIGLALQVNVSLLYLYCILLWLQFFPQLSTTYMELCINVLFVCKYTCSLKQPYVRNAFSLQTAIVAFVKRTIQLSRFCAYLDGWPSQLIKISGILLYFKRLCRCVCVCVISLHTLHMTKSMVH